MAEILHIDDMRWRGYRHKVENDREILSNVLKDMGWSGAELARRLDVSQDTVSRWATGKVPLPGPVKAYLKLVWRVKRFRDEALS